MRLNKNIFANLFNFLGDALEAFTPAAFRFLSAILPYATPIPVAWLTADSASTFLNFTPQVSFIFVFCLEGIGLWFTSLLVDSIVEAIRSHNWRSFFPVLMFIIGVGSYIYLLVNLNVLLEEATGNVSPIHSRIVTLLCFLPLITGIGNGYGKLKLERKTNIEQEKVHQEAREDKLREEERLERLEREQKDREERLERERILSETKVKLSENRRKLSEREQKVSESDGNFQKRANGLSETFRNFPKDWRSVETMLTDEQLQYIAHLNPTQVREVANVVGVTEKTVTNWRMSAKIKLGE